MEQLGEIDFNKYHTFFLEYWKEGGDTMYSNQHLVRPCVLTYEELTDKNRKGWYQLESAVLRFENSMSLSEVLVNCSLYGISIDFVDITIEPEEHKKNRWNSLSSKVIQVIDTHKEDITKYLEEIAAPKHYVVLNKRKNDVLRFLVVDRFAQDSKIKFLKGKYDEKAVVAGFKSHEEAKKYCERMNNEK